MSGSVRNGSHHSAANTTLIVAAIALAAALALLPWLHKAVYPDEVVSLRSSQLGWSALVRQSRTFDVVLLPYYGLLHLLLRRLPGIGTARAVSLLAYGLCVFLVGREAARLGGRRCGILAAVLAAADPLMVAAALSARPYALAALMATVAVACLTRWLQSGRLVWMWWFCLAAGLALLLQLFTALVTAAVLVAAAALRPLPFRRRWWALVVPLGLLSAVGVVFALVAARQRRLMDWIPSLGAPGRAASALQGPAGGAHGVFAVVVLAIVVAATAWSLRARRSRGAIPGADGTLHGAADQPLRPHRTLLIVYAVWAAAPAVALVIASLLVRPAYVDRYVTASAPGLAMAVALFAAPAWRATAPPRRLPPRLATVAPAATFGLAALALWLACALPAAQAVYHAAR